MPNEFLEGDKIFVVQDGQVVETEIKRKYVGTIYEILPHKGKPTIRHDEAFETLDDALKHLHK